MISGRVAGRERGIGLKPVILAFGGGDGARFQEWLLMR
jgi:hypothetical protein